MRLHERITLPRISRAVAGLQRKTFPVVCGLVYLRPKALRGYIGTLLLHYLAIYRLLFPPFFCVCVFSVIQLVYIFISVDHSLLCDETHNTGGQQHLFRLLFLYATGYTYTCSAQCINCVLYSLIRSIARGNITAMLQAAQLSLAFRAKDTRVRDSTRRCAPLPSITWLINIWPAC